MYISKVALSQDVDPNRLAGLLGGNEYREHQILWKFFPGVENRVETKVGGKGERAFLFRREAGKWPCFYIVSSQKPLADGGSGDLWTTHSKEYNPKIHAGQRLAFSLRVNPVRSKAPGEKGKRGVRHDVVMESKTRLKNGGVPKNQWQPMPELVAEEGWKWLSAKAPKNGFMVEKGEIRIDGYRQHWLSKHGGKPIRFSTLDFQGILTVEDPGKFKEALFNGIGSAKGFGCGLILVRKV
jgi:CRISPR system Cascade subunit CasE